jgi:hypothetical protein
VPIWTFRIGDAFDADDPLSVWMCTLALAFNDAVHTNLKAGGAEIEWEFVYEWRIAISHFTEACLHLERGREVEQVTAFLASESDIKEAFDDVLTRYESVRQFTNDIRNQAAFHYPYESGQRAVARALRDLADSQGEFGGTASNKVKDGRLFFADEVAAKLVVNAAGGTKTATEAAMSAVADAVAAFARFANAALDAYFIRYKDALTEQRGGEASASA